MIDEDSTCGRCGHLCHCVAADHEGCNCTGCNCSNNRSVWYVSDKSSNEQDKTYENEVGKSNG